MPENIEIFNSPEFGSIRTINLHNAPWFVAADVCKALELSNPTVAVNRLDDDERAKLNLGRQGETNCVNEPGLYTLVLSSRKPSAKAFKRWIVHDVIPSIRRHGMYATGATLDKMLADPDFAIKVFQELKSEREKNNKLVEENHRLAVAKDALVAEINTWDDRGTLVALIRSFSNCRLKGNFAYGWNIFYKTFRIKEGIDLKKRKMWGDRRGDSIPIVDYIRTDEEWRKAVKVAAAMCENVGLDISKTINDVNATRIKNPASESKGECVHRLRNAQNIQEGMSVHNANQAS